MLIIRFIISYIETAMTNHFIFNITVLPLDEIILNVELHLYVLQSSIHLPYVVIKIFLYPQMYFEQF